jgi:hypothetical protein
MIKERVTQEDLILYEILRHPALCWEFIMNLDKTEHDELFEWADYQTEMICDFNSHVSICCGRAVGKTEMLTGIYIWLLINNVFPEDYVMYLVPNKAQLEPVWNRMTRLFRVNSLLRHFVSTKSGINSSDHRITLFNGAIFMARIAGTLGTGANVIGLHTPFQVKDEAATFPWPDWLESQPNINTWTPGYRHMVVGVPNGFREKNVLYHADMENDEYTKHRISAHQNPRYTDEDEARSLESYGDPESDEYIQFVLGRHGKPTFAVFDRALMDVSPYPISKVILEGLKHKNEDDTIPEDFVEKLTLLPKLKPGERCIFGVDLGYTDPTAIFILKFDRRERMVIHAKIQLNKVPYPVQSNIIDLLDTNFNPLLIGMDEGSSGTAEIQKLQMNKSYLHKNYKERLIPIAFNSKLVVGIDGEGKDITKPVRPFSITLLQTYTNDHWMRFSSTDLETVSELERMVYVTTSSGNKVYRTLTPGGGAKGQDHFTAALLCAVLAWYIKNDLSLVQEKPKLGGARWLH